MNYLGHIILSDTNEPLIIGNFIGDYVKGKQYLHFPLEVQRGILYHRAIDHFTDRNPHWFVVRDYLKPSYQKYAGVVADIVVDHFLAKNWDLFYPISLNWHSKWVYATFLKYFDILPFKVQAFLPYLIQDKRLQSYAKLKGLYHSLEIMAQRTTLPNKLDETKILFQTHYSEMEKHSLYFISDILENKTKLLNQIDLVNSFRMT